MGTLKVIHVRQLRSAIEPFPGMFSDHCVLFPRKPPAKSSGDQWGHCWGKPAGQDRSYGRGPRVPHPTSGEGEWDPTQQPARSQPKPSRGEGVPGPPPPRSNRDRDFGKGSIGVSASRLFPPTVLFFFRRSLDHLPTQLIVKKGPCCQFPHTAAGFVAQVEVRVYADVGEGRNLFTIIISYDLTTAFLVPVGCLYAHLISDPSDIIEWVNNKSIRINGQ